MSGNGHRHEHASAGVSVRGLTVALGGTVVLDGVDLDADPCELHVLFGPSGAGKSTLVSALTGSLPAGASVEGEARLTGPWAPDEVTSDLVRNPARVRRRLAGRWIGCAPQAAGGTFSPTLTLRTQLAQAQHRPHRSGPAFGFAHPHRPADPARQLEELATAAGIDPISLGNYPHQFSGGQLSRLNLLAAMVNHPPVLVADEPTTGLDREAADLVGGLLAHYARSGHTVLVVTHDSGWARRWADRVTRMSDGRALATGTPEQLLPSTRPAEDRAMAPDDGLVVLASRGATVRRRERALLAPTDLELSSGELVGLTGPSGVGKSSLAAVLALLEVPHRGHLELQGRALPGAGLDLSPATRRQVGWISQHPRQAMDPRARLRDIVALPARLAGIPVDVEDLVHSLGLDPVLLDRRPHEMSGGQLQRFCVARTLTLEPLAIIADEPFSMVDGDCAETLLDRFRGAAEAGAGVLLIGHDLDRLRSACDRVLQLQPGPEGAVLREVDRNDNGVFHWPPGTRQNNETTRPSHGNTPETPPA